MAVACADPRARPATHACPRPLTVREFESTRGGSYNCGMNNMTAQLPTAREPHPTQRPVPFFGGGGDLPGKGEAENVEAALLLVESHRRLWCPHYDSCLAVAVDAGWHGWGCSSCSLAAAPPPPPPERRQLIAVPSS
jgi:hypothetical protein